MGTGYVRDDTGNLIADGNAIDAAPLDGEFDAIVAAMAASTGHTHDGTTGEGGPVSIIGPSQEITVSSGAITPATDNLIDLGSASNEFKDLYLDGTANIDSLVADTADINGGTVDGAVIGGSSAAAGTFTTITGTGTATLSTVDINGGAIDGTTIGGTTPAAGAFTTASTTGLATLASATITGTLTANGDVALGSDASDTITFNGDTAGDITPNVDDTDDLGSISQRFVDAYLSGGLYVGGTDPENKLDDFEKGPFTPSLSFGNTSVSLTYTSRGGRYTKVGDLVTFSAYIVVNNKGVSTGLARLEGLPFQASTTDANMEWHVNVSITGGVLGSALPLIGRIKADAFSEVLLQYQNSTGFTNLTETEITNGASIYVTGSYHTDS